MNGQKRTVLYIEDDPASRRLVERALTFAGYDVLVAECGLEGVDIARQYHPDLILTDINLPDLSGHEIATTLRYEDHFANTPIVALTAQSPGGIEWEMAFAAGINGYMTKPIDLETLVPQLEYYLQGGRDQIDSERLAAAQLRYTREVVTRLEKRIRELEAANKALKQLDQMKDTFIQLTAHELRTPLTLIFGYNRLLGDDPSLRLLMRQDDNLSALVEALGESVERMHSLVEEIVTISRIMTNRIELAIVPLNLPVIVQRAVNSFSKALQERHLRIVFNPHQFAVELRADAELLYIVFVNLMGNAIKYTPDGGVVTISAQWDASYLRFSVKDTGIGIDPAMQKQIFDRFQTLDDIMLHSTSKTAYRGGGLGLGLPICRGIVEAHGGQIWVESAGRDPETLPGSEFIVKLPIAPVTINKRMMKSS